MVVMTGVTSKMKSSLMVPADTLGSTHFIPDPEEKWIPAKRLAEHLWDFKTIKGVINLPKDTEVEEIHDDWCLRGVDDVCILANPSQAALLHTLRTRYNRDEIYTYISVILVAVNPFKRLSLYSTEDIELYRSAADTQALAPHVFGVAAQAFRNMIDKLKCQAILISGESGAGKTESTKFVLLYIAQVLRSENGLEEQLLQLNPILEAFGNAKTIRNDNSSRFGKWIQILVNPASMQLDKASVTDYLLEVSRVCQPSIEERNFHIFYQLTSDEALQEYPMLKMSGPANFKYLNRQSGPVADVDDFKEFHALQEALNKMGFTREEEECIFRVAAGILHLGNVEFVKDGDGSAVKNEEAVELAAEVFKVDKKYLAEMMIFKKRTTKREVMQSPQDVDKATESRNSIAKVIYKRLFEWLVVKSNKTLGGDEAVIDKNRLFIGILDIAGFEFFAHNSIEQLWINLSNEKLQQFFNNAVFKSELAEYQKEGIAISSINYSDNQIILNLIEGKGGLLPTLDDSTLGIKLPDDKLTSKFHRDHGKHAHFVKPKFVASNPFVFGIKHFAGTVMYNTQDWGVKNVSELPAECVQLMQNSTNVVLQALAGDLDTSRGMGGGKKTVSSMFVKSLRALITRLQDAEANFIRCIKPNKDKVPNKCEADLVLDQLQLSGAFETVKIRQKGFLIRQPCIEFSKRYLMLLPSAEENSLIVKCGSPAKKEMSAATGKKVAEHLISKVVPEALERDFQSFDKDQVAVGKTKVFIKADLYRALEELRRRRLVKPTTVIQARIRGAVVRIRMKIVMDTNNGLRKCTAKAGEMQYLDIETLKKDVRRASVMESTLQQMDVLLGQAMMLPIKLPRMQQFYRARAKLSAQAVVARSLSDCMVSVDVTLMEGMLARAAAISMHGSLIDQVASRRQLVSQHLHLRRQLQDAEYFDSLEDVQAVMNQAKELRLDEEDQWELDDGHDSWTRAKMREDDLLDVKAKLADVKQKLEVRMKSLTASFDEGALSGVLAQGRLHNMSGEFVDKLQARHDVLEKQIPLREALCSCAGSLEDAKLSHALELVKEQGFEDPNSWLFFDGPRLQADVARSLHQCRQNEARETIFKALQLVPPDADATVEDQLEADLFCGEDDVYLQRLRLILGIKTTKDVVGEALLLQLNSRCDEFERQKNLRHMLQSCAVVGGLEEINKALDDVKTANLETAEAWLLPEGPRLHTFVKARAEQFVEDHKAAEERVEVIKAELLEMMSSLDSRAMEGPLAWSAACCIDGESVQAVADRKATLEKEGQLRVKLLSCTVTEKIEELTEVVESAQTEGLGLQSPWLLEDGADLLQIAVNRLEKLPGMFALKNELEASVASDDLERVATVSDDAKSQGLDGANKWLISGGIDCFLALEQRRQQLQEEKERKDQLTANILEQLAKLSTSLDPTAMMGQLARAEAVGITDEAVDIVVARTTMVDEQENLFRQLLLGKVTESAEVVERAIAEVSEANLATPEGWLLPDGAEHFQNATDRSQKLATLLRLKEELQTGAGTHDFGMVKGVVDEVIAAKLDAEGRWLAVGGADRWEAAKKRLAELEEEKQWSDQNTDQIVQELTSLTSSLDISAMRGPLARAAAYSVSGEAFDVVTQREATLQKETKLCVQLLGSRVSEDVEHLETVVADVKAEGLESGDWLVPHGKELFDSVVVRAQKLPVILRLRTELENCISSDDLEEICRACEEADNHGLASAESWGLSGGVNTYEAADARRKQLLASKEGRERSIKEVNNSLQEMMSSIDVAAMTGTLARAEALNIVGQEVDDVVQRMATVKEQEQLRIKLLSVTVCEDPQLLDEVVIHVKNDGLEEGGTATWLLPDGPGLVSNAFERLSKVEGMALAKAALQDCAGSNDLEFVAEVLGEAKQQGLEAPEKWLITGGADCWAAASHRLDQLKEEEEREAKVESEINDLLDGLMSSLDDSAMGGILARATAHDIQGDRVNAVVWRKETLVRQKAVRSRLLECMVSDDLEMMEDVNNTVKSDDLDKPETWLLPDGAELYAKLVERLEMLPIMADMMSQLKACAGSTDPERLQEVLEEVQKHGLDKPESWLMPTGPLCLEAVQRRKAEFDEEKDWANKIVAEILESRQTAMESSDARFLKGWLARATMHNVDPTEFSSIMERHAELLQQQEVRLELLTCQVAEDESMLEEAIGKAQGAGLDDGSKWIFADGPELYQKVVRRLEKLATVLQLKAELMECMGSEDLEKVNRAVEEAKAVGLDKPDNWLLSGGLAIFEAAIARQARLVEVKEKNEEIERQIQQNLSDMLSSLDPALMSGTIARANVHAAALQRGQSRDSLDGDASMLRSVVERKQKLEMQQRLLLQLHKCTVSEDQEFLGQVVSEVEAAGLDVQENWLLPDGVERFNIAAERKSKIEMMLRLKSELGTCAVSDDLEQVSKVIGEAKDNGLDAPENWCVAGGSDCLLAATRREEELKELSQCLQRDRVAAEEEVTAVASSLKVTPMIGAVANAQAYECATDLCDEVIERMNMLTKQGRMRAQLLVCGVTEDLQLLESVVSEATREQLDAEESWLLPDGIDLFNGARSRLETLPLLLRLKGELQACAGSNDLAEVARVCEEVQSNGLGDGRNWCVVDGVDCWAAVMTQKAFLDRKAQRDAGIQDEVLQHLGELSTSVDSCAMKACLALAGAYGVVGEVVETVTARRELVDRQLELRTHLLASTITEQEEQITKVLEDVAKEGLDGSGKWLVQDAAATLQKAQERLQKLPVSLRVLDSLRSCPGSTDLAEVRSAVAEAIGNGLDNAENWIISGARASWLAAHSRLQELETTKRELDARKADLAAKLSNLLDAGTDVTAMTALLPQLQVFEVDNAEALQNKISVLGMQEPILKQLRECVASHDIKVVTQALASATEAGLDDGENWMIPEGPKLQERAAHWKAKLEAVKPPDTTEFLKVAEVLQTSISVPLIEGFLGISDMIGCEGEGVAGMKERLTTLRQQAECRSAMLEAGLQPDELTAAITQAEECGFALSETSFFPDGAQLTARARTLLELLPKRQSMPEGLAGQHAELFGKLVQALDSTDVSAVRAVALEAREADLGSDSWTAASGPELLDLCELWREQLLDRESVVDTTQADIQLHVNAIESMLVNPISELFVGTEMISEVKAHMAQVLEHANLREALRATTFGGADHDIEDAIVKAHDAGLGEADKWLLPEGANLLVVAQREAEWQQAQQAAKAETTAKLEVEMRELMSTLDVSPIAGSIAHTQKMPVDQELRNSLVERYETLKLQSMHRLELTKCSTTLDLSVVQGILGRLREVGLDSPVTWLLLDGPKLWTRAVDKQDQLSEVDRVKAQIEATASKYDGKGLMASMRRARDLGVAEDAFTWADKLFLDMQDEKFVEAKSKELVEVGGTETTNYIMISNLEDQLKTLGFDFGSSGMKSVVRGLGTRRTSAFETANVAELQLAEKAFSDVSNFENLRDSTEFSTDGIDPCSMRTAMLKFTSTPISRSLTKLDEEAEGKAVRVFQDIMRQMGDVADPSSADKQRSILDFARSNEDFRDEVYLQVMKQLNGNPSAWSEKAGWELFKALMGVALPTRRLRDFVQAYLVGYATNTGEVEETNIRVGPRRTLSRQLTLQFYKESRPQMSKEVLGIFNARMAAQ